MADKKEQQCFGQNHIFPYECEPAEIPEGVVCRCGMVRHENGQFVAAKDLIIIPQEKQDE